MRGGFCVEVRRGEADRSAVYNAAKNTYLSFGWAWLPALQR
jgi:hypothetical protein